jgi:choline dehydrogenase-like flavoprotein
MQTDLINAINKAAPDLLERPCAFDAIVIGAGAAGGLAAERLTKGGLNVLLLDAGFRSSFLHAPIRRIIAETVIRMANPDFLPFMPASLLYNGRRALRLMGRVHQRIQTKCYAWERRPEAFVDDLECPYTTPSDHPFFWIRARALGGRVGIPGHGRLYFRLGRDDFAPSDGESPAWPFAQEEMDRWYANVEKRLGMSGAHDALPWLPDSEIAHSLTPVASEAALMDLVKARWPGFRPVLGRSAPPADTLDGAANTGRLALRQGTIVREIEVKNGCAAGVRWFDRASRSEQRAAAPIVFLCASALESTRILMLSQDSANGRAIGAQSNALGRYLMDHIVLKADGTGAALPGEQPVRIEDGRCVYLPRFDARDDGIPKPGRGFGVQVYQADIAQKRSLFLAISFSEMLPRFENHVVLDRRRLDRWGIPVLHIDCSYGDQDLRRAADQTKALSELADAAGVSLDWIDKIPSPPGHALHECGTARMGLDPTTSVLDPNNQCWDVSGLYVTDSASFPSQGSQNPTLTVMALTERACAHALRSVG